RQPLDLGTARTTEPHTPPQVRVPPLTNVALGRSVGRGRGSDNDRGGWALKVVAILDVTVNDTEICGEV
ncbi:hypothetical protein AB0J72_57540, partial [Dactylosporangium sp. NPDC049742]|uniref:hypothetical protein n=1 Tax=Dactylosporangium sp. NPDC049742 TaxID=3154737 RepID=UPI00344600BA